MERSESWHQQRYLVAAVRQIGRRHAECVSSQPQLLSHSLSIRSHSLAVVMEGSGGSTPIGTPMATPPTTLPGAPASRGSGGGGRWNACCAGGSPCAKSAGTPGALPAIAAGPAAEAPPRPGRLGRLRDSGGSGAWGIAGAASSTEAKRERRFWAPDWRRKCFWAWEATWVGVREGT